MADFVPDLYDPEESLHEFKEGYFEETIHEVWENCVLESVKSIYNSVYKAIILNIVFGLITSLGGYFISGLPETLFHWLSAICGIFLLLSTIQSKDGLGIIFISFIIAYIILFTTDSLQKRRNMKVKEYSHSNKFGSASIVQYSLIAIFVLFEYKILEKDTWLQIRGIMMVFSMKLICITADSKLQKLPSFSEYCGYMFCCGNILFGPWISFEHYMIQTKFPTKKNHSWLLGIMRSLLWSVFFLTISNCWASYLIRDSSYSLLVGYKEAVSFRTSHYFICYLSEASMLAAGWKELDHHFDDQYWRFPITNFLEIELPSSLAIVVTNWNKPMHEFLKKYIYRKWLPLGKFYAVLLTFVISSLFHGFELKVSTVLISLGIFSYLQILVREHISEAFDICVEIRPCKQCKHKLKRESITCKLTLMMFSLITVLHLIFLGILMDESTDDIGIYQKWNNLNFMSLWIMLINYLIVK